MHRTRGIAGDDGFSLIEVMLAMMILPFAILGVMGMFQWADLGQQQGAHGTRALAMVQSRLEAKRAVPWETLLMDDMNADGVPEIQMRDDGTEPDEQAGDGIYTAGIQEDGIRLVWTVQADHAGSLRTAGSVVIQAHATYSVGRGQRREIRIGTVRANPRYLGMQ
jgi:prepilin-type N-terminal cleavage/methylation domain-containing protein